MMHIIYMICHLKCVFHTCKYMLYIHIECVCMIHTSFNIHGINDNWCSIIINLVSECVFHTFYSNIFVIWWCITHASTNLQQHICDISDAITCKCVWHTTLQHNICDSITDPSMKCVCHTYYHVIVT